MSIQNNVPAFKDCAKALEEALPTSAKELAALEDILIAASSILSSVAKHNNTDVTNLLSQIEEMKILKKFIAFL